MVENETAAQRLERMAKEKRDRLDKQLHESKGWAWWRNLSSTARFWIGGVVIVIIVVAVVSFFA